MEIEEETIQDIYEKAHKELYDNILIRDMQIRIENRINTMAREYLEKLGLGNTNNNNIFEGTIEAPDFNTNNGDDATVDFKIKITLYPLNIKIESDNPEFNFD